MGPLRREGFALLVVLGVVVVVGLGALLVGVRMAQEAEMSRLEALGALAEVDLDGEQNRLLLRLAGPAREELRRVLGEAGAGGGGRWAFGVGEQAPSASSAAAALEGVRRALQAWADAALCPEGWRVHFSARACGEALPEDVPLAAPGFVSGSPRAGGPPAVQRYRLPFVARVRGQAGATLRERYLRGAFEFDVGAALPSRYALILDNAYDHSGRLGLLGSSLALEGRVHVAGLVGVEGRPWFAGPLTSGSCPALGVAGECVGAPTPGMAFAGAGFVGLAQLLPSPDRPCLGGDCPVWGDGVDLSLPGLGVGRFALAGWSPSLSLATDASRVRLWPQDGVQHLELCGGWGCSVFRVAGDRLQREVGGGWVDEAALPVEGGVVRLRVQVDGPVERLEGGPFGRAVAEGVGVELVATGDVRVVSSLVYERSPCAFVGGRSGERLLPSRCDDLAATNRLAVLSLGGDIVLGQGNADASLNLDEDNPRLQGQFLAPRGSVGAERPESSPARGVAFVLGSLAMGRWAPWDPWRLSLTYDPRLQQGGFLGGEGVLASGVLGVYLRLEGEQRAR
jgi:hypothetical protein